MKSTGGFLIQDWILTHKRSAGVIILVILVLVEYLFLIKPIWEKYHIAQALGGELSQEYARKLQQSVLLEKEYLAWHVFKTRYNQAAGVFLSMNKRVLEENILNAGSKIGVLFKVFAPKPRVQVGFYWKIPILVTISGEYPQLMTFIYQLISRYPLLSLDYLKIQSTLPNTLYKNPKKFPKNLLEMTLNLGVNDVPQASNAHNKLISQVAIPSPILTRNPFQAQPVTLEHNESLGACSNAPLGQYALKALAYVGTLRMPGSLWALIKLPNTQIIAAQLGTYIGRNCGKITHISFSHVRVGQFLSNPDSPSHFTDLTISRGLSNNA